MEQNTTLPNFLIVGMAKCGTSSLAQYLQQHPEIHISAKKEPRFITSVAGKFPEGGPKDHLVKAWYVTEWSDYLSLFEGRKETAIGEASADTLYYYKDTIPIIKQYLGDPEIIILLRDPVKRAFSAYQHLVRDEREHLSFEQGLQAEEERKQNSWELIYYYKSAGLYYEAVKAFMESFSQVKVLLNEELRDQPQETLRDTFKFIGVHDYLDVSTNISFNSSGKPKSQFMHDSLQGETWLRKAVRPLARAILPSREARSAAVNWLAGRNLDKLAINPETESELRMFFKEDVLKTQELLQKDLSSWLP